MVSLKALLVVLAVPASSLATPLSSREAGHFKTSIREKLPAAPAGWERDDSVKLDKNAFMVKLRIHLVQQGMRKFHDLAMKVRGLVDAQVIAMDRASFIQSTPLYHKSR